MSPAGPAGRRDDVDATALGKQVGARARSGVGGDPAARPRSRSGRGVPAPTCRSGSGLRAGLLGTAGPAPGWVSGPPRSAPGHVRRAEGMAALLGRLIENCEAGERESKCYVTRFHYRCEVILSPNLVISLEPVAAERRSHGPAAQEHRARSRSRWDTHRYSAAG